MRNELAVLGLANQVHSPYTGPEEIRYPLSIGLFTKVVASSIFPLSLRGWFVLLALRHGSRIDAKVVLRSPSGRAVFELRMVTIPKARDEEWDGWDLIAHPLVDATVNFLIMEPGQYVFEMSNGATATQVGTIAFYYIPASPLTEEQKLALRANPLAYKFVSLRIRDSITNRELTAYVGLERPEECPKGLANPVWYQDLPDEFALSGDQPPIPLKYLRESMHALLLSTARVLPTGHLDSRPLYSPEAATAVLDAFSDLLAQEPSEEEVQKYIEANLLLLGPFAGHRVFLKPPILTHYKADFGIVNARNELLLIEIERPSLRLFNRTGARSADLEVPFNQIRSWLEEIDKDRMAALRCIRGCPEDVIKVKGCVIAGRSRPEDSKYLRRLQGAMDDRIDFMTYDQLLRMVQDTMKHAGLVGA